MREGVIDNRKLTPYRGLDEVLIDYAHTSRAVLGDNFIGLYLLGSLAIGDFDLTSDVDFMIVTNSELSRDQVELVQSAHTKLLARDRRWVRHLEYSIFPRQKLSEKSSPYGPHGRDDSAARQLWYFNNGGSAIERSDHDNTLVTRWTLRYRSKAVLGAEPAAFAPEVTSDELRQEIRNSMLGWEKLFTPDSPYNNRFHQVFFVLNNCRALQGLHEGKITSKRETPTTGRTSRLGEDPRCRRFRPRLPGRRGAPPDSAGYLPGSRRADITSTTSRSALRTAVLGSSTNWPCMSDQHRSKFSRSDESRLRSPSSSCRLERPRSSDSASCRLSARSTARSYSGPYCSRSCAVRLCRAN